MMHSNHAMKGEMSMFITKTNTEALITALHVPVRHASAIRGRLELKQI